MKSPAELDHVQWHDLTHAYGPAADVPELIRALYDDEESAAEAIDELYGTIYHQGTVYDASAPAVPFLAHAVLHAPGKRDELLMMLAVLADHEPTAVDSPRWSGGPTAAICAELCRVLPDLLPCLGDDERAVRRAAIRTVAAVADLIPARLRDRVVEGLDALYAEDPVPAVRADALVALDRFGRRTAALDHPLPEVRLTAALLGLERSVPPYAAELVEVVAEDGPETGGEDDFPWSDTSTQDERLTRLLTRDPDSGLTVAARWIAAGDHASHGSWLAQDIAERWRDREAEVLDLLLAALPHQKDGRARTGRLRSVAAWIDFLPEPGTDLRNTLHRYAVTDEESAEPALLALARSRDPRALDLVLRRPGAQLIAAAARHFPDAADLLIPVIRRELAAGATDNAAITLVEALAPFGPAARAAEPELVDCLRTGRAAIVAARRLGHNGVRTREITDLLHRATQGTDGSLTTAAAVAHHQLTGDLDTVLRVFEPLLSGRGQSHWYLSRLEPMGSAAAPLLPSIEPLLDDERDWTRMAAAEAHHRITGSPDRAVPVLVALVGATPVGLSALKALAATGRVPAELRPTLRSFADSPRRLLGDTRLRGEVHPDAELRAVARTLLATD
ncbi:hypothetical protein [Streptomyces adustus]|uniref:hypothetical protein n=1 Tax=Streptomyces adustus TaxID=1609272 RepID=UPI00371CE155